MSTWDGRPRLSAGAAEEGDAGSELPDLMVPPDTLPVVGAPGTEQAPAHVPDHLAVRQALRARQNLLAYLVVTSVPNQWTRRRVLMTLTGARNAASAARRRGHRVTITLQVLTTAAVVDGPST